MAIRKIKINLEKNEESEMDILTQTYIYTIFILNNPLFNFEINIFLLKIKMWRILI